MPVGIILWSLVVEGFFSPSKMASLVLFTLGAWVGSRFYVQRTIENDRTSYAAYNVTIRHGSGSLNLNIYKYGLPPLGLYPASDQVHNFRVHYLGLCACNGLFECSLFLFVAEVLISVAL
ncbi:hypothetical protein DFH08DRAFT_723762 [Mycena albidolilacea]|uniref:Uncharacterized protein n=1 Tax=Mycena albidolilacea TaxID=1033008 RepID=A0AAD6YYM8_9AGAR|nr:hypothetical protein DFH08DRAFT_723762 [Mycena albidolilacea]